MQTQRTCCCCCKDLLEGTVLHSPKQRLAWPCSAKTRQQKLACAYRVTTLSYGMCISCMSRFQCRLGVEAVAPCAVPCCHVRPRDTVKKSASAHAGQPVNWVVVDVSRQPSFRRAYGFTLDQLPAQVALSTKRMRFAQVNG